MGNLLEKTNYFISLFKKNLDFDKSSVHKKLRLKGEPGEVVIANVGFGRPVTIERYNNEDYIRDYEKRKQEYELKQQQLKNQLQQTDKNLA